MRSIKSHIFSITDLLCIHNIHDNINLPLITESQTRQSSGIISSKKIMETDNHLDQNNTTAIAIFLIIVISIIIIIIIA